MKSSEYPFSVFSFLSEHAGIADTTEGKLANEFRRGNEDDVVRRLNNLIIDIQVFTRQKDAISTVQTEINMLLDAYTLYKSGHLTKQEYTRRYEFALKKWVQQVGKEFFLAHLEGSGTSGQYIQYLRGLGILTDVSVDLNRWGDLAEITRQIQDVVTEIATFPIDFSGYLSVVEVDPSNLNETFRQLHEMYFAVHQCLQIIARVEEQGRDQPGGGLSQAVGQKDVLRELSMFLTEALTSILKAYPKHVFVLPKRLSLFLLRSKQAREMSELKRIIKQKREAYADSLRVAMALGYEVGVNNQHYKKSDKT